MSSLDRSPPRFIVAQIGARRHYAIPTILESAGYLARFYTDLTASAGWLRAAGSLVPPLCQPMALRRLLARRIARVPREKISHFNGFALSRIVRRERARTPAQQMHRLADQNRQFGRIVCAARWGDADGVYVFNGAGLEILRQAREREMFCVLEQTSAAVAFEERLLAEERRRWPGWETSDVSQCDWAPLAEREREEWALADQIICGSDYVVRSIEAEGGPSQKCSVVPYGVDAGVFMGATRRRHDRPLRVIAVGTVTLGKGFQYLVDVGRRLRADGVEIRVVGPIRVSELAVAQLREHLMVVRSVPRDRMQEHYSWADIFVLPTLSEGSANVCYEALASGLPVITTDHAGSVVRDGLEGFIIPIRSSETIVDAILQLDASRSRIEEMSRAAIDRAREFTMDAYARRLIAVVNQGRAGASPVGAGAGATIA